MTGNEFKAARKTCLKYSQEELAVAMETHKRVIQDVEAKGDEEIRGIYKVCIELLIWKDRVTMQGIIEAVDQAIKRDYPHGFQSVAVRE